MGSKREEERNEKIIRGLMKLPPNRRCINCNNLGPQYVCTNFWTFICQTCSGIHREFTHRVKSVSMAKFTSQEVEALQKGGNQRARETFLVHWEPQRQRQPNSSNIEKVREFIKHVYMDKKYTAGIASDKPPRETLNLRNPEDETRRASSYHSYSQSPPYDYQYEERRYGKQLPALTRKPGSDRGLYEGKVSNFSSPSRFSDQTLEHPRPSDYSVSSPGLSPSCQKDGRVRSPSHQATDNIAKENSERFRRTQRATSSGSFGSFDSNSMSFKSNNSVSLADFVSGTEQSAESIQDKHYANSSLQQSSTSGNFGGLDLFEAPFAPQIVAPSPVVDLFQIPERQAKAPIDVSAPSYTSSVPNVHAQKPSETTSSSLSFFSQMPQQPPPASMGTKSQGEVIQNNNEWAMFDFPQHTPPNNPPVVHSAPPGVFSNGGYIEKVDTLGMSSGQQWPVFEGSNAHEPTTIHCSGVVYTAPSRVLPNGGYIEKVDSLPVPITGQQWPVFEGSGHAPESTLGSGHAPESTLMNNLAHEPISMHSLWQGEPYKSQVSCTNIQQSWNVFEDSNRQLSYSATHQSGQEVAGEAPFTTVDEHFGQSWNAFEDPTRQLSESAAHQSGQEVAGQAPFTTADEHLGQSWNAFEDPTRQLSYSATHLSCQEVAGQGPFTTADEHLGGFNQARFERVVLESRPPITGVPLHVKAHSHVIERKSSNPFDLSDDCDFESGSIYFNMNSLQAAVPSGQLTNSFVDDATQSWFSHNPAPHYIPAAQGALGYIGGPAAGTQLPNVAAQEPVASVGGNPFT